MGSHPERRPEAGVDGRSTWPMNPDAVKIIENLGYADSSAIAPRGRFLGLQPLAPRAEYRSTVPLACISMR
jgi:hypothetical protein